MNKRILTTITAVILLAGLPLSGIAANKKTSVTQVTAPVTVSDDEDYTVTSATPFAEGGSIDITNTDHAVVILSSVKPSAAIKLLSNITINGQKAVNNTNCQVKMYNLGAIILPYGNSVKPLTVYSEPDFGGTAVSDFGTEHSGGYMNTLSEAKLNNKIRSFRLKRGYMVTFSTRPSGRGYSRCFIAADADLEVPSLPAVLDSRISSYRVFKWYDAGKKQLANDTRSNVLAALNVQSSYDWGQGNGSLLPDYEWVPNHIYEDWPSSATIGGTTQSPHTKNNNEPRNSSDDHPQDLATILGNWENMMRTGMRLCSPASWDGSDYSNATGFLADFLDSIDARGWRCDIIDLHCYWPEDKFGNIKNWVNKYKRPVWISEWCWGASWNKNGAFAPGVTQNDVKSALQRICANLNSWNYVERYYYWNSEAAISKLYDGGKLTPAGEYYASMNSGLGYNGKYDFVPTTPRQYPPTDFKATPDGDKVSISWRELNGEYNQLMQIERKLKGGQWEVFQDVTPKESGGTYTITADGHVEGAQYRLHLIDLNGNSHYSNNDLQPGDEVKNAEGETRYVGGNLLTNGDFDLGAFGWVTGTGSALGQPHFQVVPVGGFGGGSYLQAYTNVGTNAAGALRTYVAIQPNTEYLFRCASRNGGTNQRVSVSPDNTSAGTEVVKLQDSSDWLLQSATFNSGDNSYALISFRMLQAKAQFDKMELRPLFKTRQEAVADGLQKVQLKAQTVMAYNDDPTLAALNTELEQRLGNLTTTGEDAIAEAETAISELLQAIVDCKAIDSLNVVIGALRDAGVTLPDALDKAWAVAPQYYTAAYFTSHRQEMQQALDEFLAYTDAEVQPQSANFSGTAGWQVKVGTYTGGDQRTNTYGGLTCWNAWWANLSAAEGAKRSMEIRQQVEALPEGLYALECKGSTQHYCLSDQHGYMVYDGDTLATPRLTADYMDLPTVPNIWQTLTTAPVYVSEGGNVTIGFVSTKQGAVNNAWRAFGDASNSGDRREGWWCATDFRLLYHPMLKLTVTPGEWSTICLPYASSIPQGAKCYRIAGVLKDYSCICIEEVPTLEAGVPAIYISDVAQLTFSEYGEKAKSPVSYKDANNLRGYFLTTTAIKAPAGSYVLTGGKWVKVESVRPSIPSNSAIIYKLDGMTELDAWNGLTMPLVDGTDAIDAPQRSARPEDACKARTFNLSGQPTTTRRGVVIEKQDGQTRKVILTP